MKTRTFALSFIFCLAAIGIIHAEPFVIPWEMAGDNIQIFEIMPDGSYQLRTVVAKEHYQDYLGQGLVTLHTEPFTGGWSAYIFDATTGASVPQFNVDNVYVSYSMLQGETFSFAIPNSRAGHVFAVVGYNKFYVVNTTGPIEDRGFFTAQGGNIEDGGALYDITAQEWWGSGQTNLVATGPPSPYSTTPFAGITVIFPDQASNYTLHTSGGSLQGLYPNSSWDGSATIFTANGAVPWGETYWFTRDIDNAQSATFTSPANPMADTRNSMQPFVYRNLVASPFNVGDERLYHDLAVRHGDGYTTHLTPYYSGTFYLQYWDDSGVQQNYSYSQYTADIDAYQSSWEVIDETTGESLGQNFDLFTGYDQRPHHTQPNFLAQSSRLAGISPTAAIPE